MAYHCGAPTRDGSACQRHVREQGMRCHQHRALGGAALPPLRLAMRTITLEDPALTAGPAAWMSVRDEIAAAHAAQWDTPPATAQDGPDTMPTDPEPTDSRQPYRSAAPPHSRPTRILFGDPDDDLPQRRHPRPEREDVPNEPARPDQRGTRIIEDYLRRHEQGEDEADARRERQHQLAEEARRELERRQAENGQPEQEQSRADEHRSEQERRLADERRREQEQRQAEERRREQERHLAEQARRKREQREADTQDKPEDAETDDERQKAEEVRREQEQRETEADTQHEPEDVETEDQRQRAEEARREQERRLAEQAQRKRQQREAEEARREQEQREAREARREQQQRRVEEARRERERREAEEQRREQERRQADDARWREVADLFRERDEQPEPDARPLFRDEAPTLIQPRVEPADEVPAPAPPRPPRVSPLRSVVLNAPEPAPEPDPDPPTLVGLPDGLTVPDLVVPGFTEPAPKPPLRTVLSTVLGPELWQRCYAEWGPAHCISLARVARAVDGLAPSAAAALRSTAGASMRWLGVNREREELADQVANAISHPVHASDANRARTVRLYGAAICVALNIPMRRCACHRDLDRDVSGELIRLGLEELAGEVP